MIVKTHAELMAESARLTQRVRLSTLAANATAQELTRFVAKMMKRGNELAEARGDIPKGRGHLRIVT
jgi:hypothetical protein